MRHQLVFIVTNNTCRYDLKLFFLPSFTPSKVTNTILDFKDLRLHIMTVTTADKTQ